MFDFEKISELTREEDFRDALSKAFEDDDGDGEIIAGTLAQVILARSLVSIANDADVHVDELINQLTGSTTPEMGTMIKVIRALGIEVKLS